MIQLELKTSQPESTLINLIRDKLRELGRELDADMFFLGLYGKGIYGKTKEQIAEYAKRFCIEVVFLPEGEKESLILL